MPPLNVLIKPVSSLCNLNCSYCFYQDVSSHRQAANPGTMSLDTLEQVVKRIFEYADTECTIAWQGGEPTLAGLSFFQDYLQLETTCNRKKIPVHRAIQTNGFALDAKWAAFLSKHHFLTGLSLDGIESTHNAFRKTRQGEESFSSVLAAAGLLKQFHADYNILTVINRKTAPEIREIYAFFQKQAFRYQQYIVCLDPLEEEPGLHPWSLTPELYGSFLTELFELWYQDALKGCAPYIRQFENYIGILLGIPPESCEQNGNCGYQIVIEADGSVYPCDFYVTDSHCLGNVKDSSFEELQHSLKQQTFLKRSIPLPENCKKCDFLPLCRNGCYRHRSEKDGIHFFCDSYKRFFGQCLPQLKELAYLAAVKSQT
ncbi:MAG: anaerobic sulfatase maturase [Lachnospiraceae bacterium]|nr:anaerobic sulfatase maturase [Lachnospiraceae bacterium]